MGKSKLLFPYIRKCIESGGHFSILFLFPGNNYGPYLFPIEYDYVWKLYFCPCSDRTAAGIATIVTVLQELSHTEISCAQKSKFSLYFLKEISVEGT